MLFFYFGICLLLRDKNSPKNQPTKRKKQKKRERSLQFIKILLKIKRIMSLLEVIVLSHDSSSSSSGWSDQREILSDRSELRFSWLCVRFEKVHLLLGYFMVSAGKVHSLLTQKTTRRFGFGSLFLLPLLCPLFLFDLLCSSHLLYHLEWWKSQLTLMITLSLVFWIRVYCRLWNQLVPITYVIFGYVSLLLRACLSIESWLFC